jgi:AraC-like DNA-binding protein
MISAELSFLYGESVPRCTHHIDKVFVGYSTLQCMTAGGVELTVGERRQRLLGPWFWSAWPGPRIAFHVAPGYSSWRHRYIAFRGSLLKRWQQQRLFPIDPQPFAGGLNYPDRFDALLAGAARPGKLANLRAIHLLEGLLIDLAEQRAQAQPSPPAWLRKTLDRLDAAVRAGEACDYADLAAELGMAETTFRRRFRQATGHPPHEYVLQRRVAEARRLLAQTSEPIKSIARQLGYQDVYFFSRQFRRFAGVSPGMFRRSREG